MTRIAVVGAGHNGLVSGCVLANAGLDVTIFEANETPGGCVWTEQLPSGHRIERGAIDHGLILGVVEELELGRFGLEYAFRDVTAGAGYGDGTRLLFNQDLAATLRGFAHLQSEDIDGYKELARIGSDVMAMLGGFAKAPSLVDIAEVGELGGFDSLRMILSSSEKVVGSYVSDPYLAGALRMHGAFTQLPPWVPGTGAFGFLLAGSHGHGPGRPIGGSVRLIEALVAALESAGGRLRTGEAVMSLEGFGREAALTTSSGYEARFDVVVSGIDVRRTCRLVVRPTPDLEDAARAVASGSLNVAEFKVDLALSSRAEPGRFGHPEAIWMLQSEPGSIDRAFGEIVAGLRPSEPSMLWASPSALDPSGAPPGGGTAWMSSFVPARLRDGDWTDSTVAATAEQVIDAFEKLTGASIRRDIVDMKVTGPPAWEERTGAEFGNPNHLDMTIDQMFARRPPTGRGYRTGLAWLYLSGAGAYPGGGLSGLPGRNAAMAVLGDLGSKHARRNARPGLAAVRRGWRLYRSLKRR